MAKTPTPTQAAKTDFKIDDAVAVPPRTKDVPEYGIPFANLKKGQSLVIPSSIPKEHARLLIGRYSRAEKLDMPTRTEKNAKGDEIGIRVWNNGPKAAE